ncbi:MAG: PEGA domain-containing protein [Planctomycetales bacterium]|nr:PEGA domain-containing protein [Planctomycetales bacterium]
MAFALVALTATSGCVHRRLTIRTNPPGAAVYVDDFPIGTSPVSTSFIYYGTRKIRLVKDGYETLTVEQKISPPWYQYFPLDFVSENVVPTEIRDERVLDFNLAPQMVVPTDQLIGRAEQLRANGRGGGVNLVGAELPFGSPTLAAPQSTLPLPGQPVPPQYGTEPVPGIRELLPGELPPPGYGAPAPQPGPVTLPPGGMALPPSGFPAGATTMPPATPGPSLNPFARPTVPPPTPGLPAPGLSAPATYPPPLQ